MTDVGAGIRWFDAGGVPVAVFDEHHHALLPWSRWARDESVVRLFTIDWHCDTMPAFSRAASTGGAMDTAKRERLVGRLDPTDEASVLRAIADLAHDEHIDAAIRSGMLNAAFVVARTAERPVLSDQHLAWRAGSPPDPAEAHRHRRLNPPPTGPFTYAMPDDGLVAIHPPTFLRNGADRSAWPADVLESDHLDCRLAIFDQMCRSEGVPTLREAPFILDIDLDALNVDAVWRPADPSTFQALASQAIGITVAREPSCFSECWEGSGRPDVEAAYEGVRRLVGWT